MTFFETLVQDIRYGVRILLRRPVFTAGAVVALALGIGANTAIFSLTNAILLRPFSVRDPASLVSLYHTDLRNPGSFSPTSYPEYLDYRDHSEVFAGMTSSARIPVNLSGGSLTRRGSAELVTADYFKVLGVNPVIGRPFLPEEAEGPRAHPVAVISHALWQDGFGADPDLGGKTVKLSGHAFQVIGVLPRAFSGMTLDWGEKPDVWVPLSMYAQANPALAGTDLLNHRDMPWLLVIGRLKDHLQIGQARAAIRLFANHGDRALAEDLANRSAILLPIQEARFWPGFRETIIRFLILLQCAVACVLLIACANVANLMLEHASARRQEMAVRLALGAPRRRLVRILLIEGLLIAALGAAAGLVVAVFTKSLLTQFGLPFRIRLNIEAGFDWRVMGFAFTLSLLTVLFFGVWPAFRASRAVRIAAGTQGATGRTIAGRSPLTGLLVILQVACSLVLLVAAGLFTRTLINARSADPGFVSRDLILFTVDPATQGYKGVQTLSFYEQVLARVIPLPGVRSATWARDIPLDISRTETKIRPAEAGAAAAWTPAEYNVVGPGYFRTMTIALLQGRDFTDEDREGTTRVVIVNDTLARKYWPAGNALGQRIEIQEEARQALEVVAVARDLKYHELGESSHPYFYLPLLQQTGMPMMTLHVDPAGSAAPVIAAVRQQIRALDRELPVFIEGLDEHTYEALSQPRLAASLLGWAGILAATLAAVGIYAVLAYSVSLRLREIGVRVAIGARPGDILWMVFREGMTLVLAGLASGLFAALGSVRLIANYLYGVPATDIATFSGVAFFLAAVACLACLVPARRAAQSDPVKILRHD